MGGGEGVRVCVGLLILTLKHLIAPKHTHLLIKCVKIIPDKKLTWSHFWVKKDYNFYKKKNGFLKKYVFNIF